MEIDQYTERMWGATQADLYVDEIESFCNLLAQNPSIGRKWREDQPTARRIEYASHVIYYRQQAEGITILRVLHRKMLPPRRSK